MAYESEKEWLQKKCAEAQQAGIEDEAKKLVRKEIMARFGGGVLKAFAHRYRHLPVDKYQISIGDDGYIFIRAASGKPGALIVNAMDNVKYTVSQGGLCIDPLQIGFFDALDHYLASEIKGDYLIKARQRQDGNDTRYFGDVDMAALEAQVGRDVDSIIYGGKALSM